ncbi:thiol:disulfide interchange protein DsbA/DsbL [Undibacterium piscinae]|uniref:Thiol:disulfide interchange protein DsbA n=1 Tax=Undibacterium piscinae TaxID=2495591 RepID=A0A6M4A4T1_9BURK|nr:thiol:disulfide interchange protein DsbA/DsbL [Undibacterium piscinae]
MRLIRKMLMVLSLSFMAAAAGAAVGNPENGKEYKLLERPQPVESSKKIEVIEFFGYFCPHCNVLEPLLADWVKKQGDNIVFKRVHVNFHGLASQQKLYYSLEAMGKIEEFHVKVFNAYHVDRNRLQTDADVMDFVTKSGLDKQKFSDVYNSFAIQSKLSRSAQQMAAFQIDSVPTLVVDDGRYVTAPSMTAAGMGRVPELGAESVTVSGIGLVDCKSAKRERISGTPLIKAKR